MGDEEVSHPKRKNTRDDITHHPSQKTASIALPSFQTMSIQHCRMTNFSSALSRIGRQSTKANIGSTTGRTLSQRWNQKSSTVFPPSTIASSIRHYAIVADTTMIATHSQVGTKTTGHNFVRALADLGSFFGLGRTATETAVASNSNSMLSWAIWLIKRTYQPSLLKKKRQCGYMKRKQTVGGRRILKRRRKKGRKRLFGA